VKTLLKKYDHLTGQDGNMSAHIKKYFHEDCITRAWALEQTVKSERGGVHEQLNAAAAISAKTVVLR
jgi:hypothetical protein